MKRNEIITLNDVEYTLELNRDSFLKIDQYCNLQESINKATKNLYEYIDEVNDDVDPFSDDITQDSIIEDELVKENTMFKVFERAFWIWLYPNHKLSISQVKEILKPYFEDDDKINFITDSFEKYLQASVEIRNEVIEERKNLKALANKKK